MILQKIQMEKFKRYLFFILLFLGVLCFVLAIVTQEKSQSMQQETIPVIVGNLSQNVDLNEPKKEIKAVEELGQYEYLLTDISDYVETDNVVMTYNSIPLSTEGTQSLTLKSGIQNKNRLFSISTDSLSFTLYYIDNVTYLTLSDNQKIKLYRVDTEGDYVEKISNTTKGLISLLQDLSYDNYNYAGLAYTDNNEYMKLVIHNQGSVDRKDVIENTIAVKPLIEVFEVELQPEEVDETESMVTQNELIDDLTNITNFNVLTEPGKCIFYFDKDTQYLKKLYIRNSDSISTINIDNLREIILPDGVVLDKAEVISEDKVGRLMLSSIFAMVSHTELNELKIGVE